MLESYWTASVRTPRQWQWRRFIVAEKKLEAKVESAQGKRDVAKAWATKLTALQDLTELIHEDALKQMSECFAHNENFLAQETKMREE